MEIHNTPGKSILEIINIRNYENQEYFFGKHNFRTTKS